jgi:cardiolipin synthase
MNLKFIPNLITIARIVLIAPVVWALSTEQFTLALILFAIAGLSDGVDGLLARYYGWQSWLGSVLDPLADKLLQAASYITLAILGFIPVWLVAVVVARDAIIVSGSAAYYFLFRSFEAAPSLISKLNTVMQIVYVLLVIVSISVFPMPAWFITLFGYTMLATTLASGVHYVSLWYALARQRYAQKKSNG